MSATVPSTLPRESAAVFAAGLPINFESKPTEHARFNRAARKSPLMRVSAWYAIAPGNTATPMNEDIRTELRVRPMLEAMTAPADTRTIMYMRDLLAPGAAWGALGIGRLEMPVMAQTALLGGNVRVGLEDNLYLSRGVFATNGQLVERARSILEGLGLSLATAAEARKILGLRA